MVNVRGVKCRKDGCSTQPCFGDPTTKIVEFCKAHAPSGFTNVLNKMCIHPDCSTRPNYNLPGESTPIYCKKHSPTDAVQVTGKKCTHPNCMTRPTFGTSKGKAIHCANHRTPDETDVLNATCHHSNCQTHPIFNLPGETIPIFCSKHATPDMIDIVTARCPNCVDWPDSAVANRKYRNYCARCFQRLFPNDPLTFGIQCKTKEIAVRDFLNANYSGFVHDRAITTPDCSCLRRIDHRKLIDDTLLCIETDENQHKSYNKEDEEKRYNDIHITWGVGKVIWIRFNPDSYRVKNVKKNPHISTRLRALAKEIDHHVSRIENDENTNLVEIHLMYYDH
jgi:hypothetical protein